MDMIKTIVKFFIPGPARRWIRSKEPVWLALLREPLELFQAYRYDFKRYGRHRISRLSERRRLSAMGDEQLAAFMVMHAHSIERGLSLPEVRPLFGEAKLSLITRLIKEAEARGGRIAVSEELDFAKEAIGGYIAWHKSRGLDPVLKFNFLEEFDRPGAEDGTFASNLLLKRTETSRLSQGTLEEVMHSRHSIRRFSERDLDLSLVKKAVLLASTTPTVCNRQGARVHMISSRKKIMEALVIQGGSSGFLENVPVLLIVSAKLATFFGNYERNQPYVDGGLFGMSLMLALHHYGLAACPLNWCALPGKDLRFRRTFGFPEDEVIVMLLAVGFPPEEVLVPGSKRFKSSSRVHML